MAAGSLVTDKTKEAIQNLVRNARNMRGVGMTVTPSGVSIGPSQRRMQPRRGADASIITARITDQDGTDGWIYAWEQVQANVSGYTVVTSGLTGTVTDKPAKDINRQPYLRPGDFVLLRSTSEKQGDDSSKTIWEIVEQPESRGQYKGQVRATVAQNVEGHDWFRAHPATV